MKLYESFTKRPFLTGILLAIIISISVGVMYQRILDNISFYEILFGFGLNSVTISLLDYSIRFLLAGFSLFLVLPHIFYQKPRNITEYIKELKLVQCYSWTKTISCGLISYLLFVTVTSGLAILLGVFTENPFIFLDAPGGGYAGWLLPIAAINAGFFEEIGFRGVLFTNMQKKYSGWVVIIITAIFFGLFHLGGLFVGDDPNTVLFMVIMSTLFGLSWGYMTLKTNSVIPSIIAHYLIDATGEALLYPNTTDQILTGQFFMGITFLYPIISIIAIKLILLTTKQVNY
jgi:membrane protease YdiL (CAAX protease family)